MAAAVRLFMQISRPQRCVLTCENERTRPHGTVTRVEQSESRAVRNVFRAFIDARVDRTRDLMSALMALRIAPHAATMSTSTFRLDFIIDRLLYVCSAFVCECVAQTNICIKI